MGGGHNAQSPLIVAFSASPKLSGLCLDLLRLVAPARKFANQSGNFPLDYCIPFALDSHSVFNKRRTLMGAPFDRYFFRGRPGFDEGFGFDAGHAEHQLARKSIWKQSNCKRRRVRSQVRNRGLRVCTSRRVTPASLAPVRQRAGLEGKPESARSSTLTRPWLGHDPGPKTSESDLW